MLRLFLVVFCVLWAPLNGFSQNILFEDTFEAGLGHWSNSSSGDNKDWSRDSGGTPSSGTGPSAGADGSLNYVYLETSNGAAYSAGDTAILLSPALSNDNLHIAFQYHMFGSDMGALSLDILSAGTWINDIWSITGQQHGSNGEAYSAVDIDLSSYSVAQVRFRATAAGGYRGDMALDGIVIYNLPTEPVPPHFLDDPLNKKDAIQDQPYSDSITADASDGNGDILTFQKIDGPAWLTISDDGQLSGTPFAIDVGLNSFSVEVSDGFFAESTTLNIMVHDASAPILLYSDNFESGLGNWSNVSVDDNKNWARDSFGTPSSSTGPSAGAENSTYYMYVETSSGYAYSAGDSAILLGPSITSDSIHVVFQYHMYGSDTGTLSLDILSGGQWINDIWSISGQQQSSSSQGYTLIDVDLSDYAVEQVRFRVTAVGGYRGDIAIDNIEILRVPEGPAVPYFNDNPLEKADAAVGQPYNDFISSDATDANGDELIFSKVSGPSWLFVSSDGDLTGTPADEDTGVSQFVVEVSDGTLSSQATLNIEVVQGMATLVLHSDDFESGMGSWNNVTIGDTKDWTRDANGTSSSSTGPSTGADGSLYYAYMETSSGYAYYAGDSAILLGPALVDTGLHVAFRYHMYGSNIGTLSLDVLVDGVWIEDVWSVSGQQQTTSSDSYGAADVDLSNYAVSQLRFRGTAAGGYMGDMALDNIEIYRKYDPSDLDGDGVGNGSDQCPNTPLGEVVDSNGCSALQIDSDNDGVADIHDAFPNDSSEWLDTDNDGIGDNGDTDDDGDGVADVEDAFPLDSSEWVDTDNDGSGNNSDPDDDNDGVNDVTDTFPLDPNENADHDLDGIGDNADTDDDNDGVLDIDDGFPLISLDGRTDTDGDGIPNTCDAVCVSLGMVEDIDDDNDGFTDSHEIQFSSDPLDPNDTPVFVFSELYSFDGPVNDSMYGGSIADAGDLDGDSISDIIIGGYKADNYRGIVQVFSGSDGTLMHDLQGDDEQDYFGSVVSGAGDVNGDGYQDFLVGRWRDNTNSYNSQNYSGDVRVYSGSTGQVLYVFTGDQPVYERDLFGVSAAAAGDVNNDGYADIIVGATQDNNNGGSYSEGSAQVFSGADGSVLYTFDGDGSQDLFGDAVSGIGDVNGDGYDDVVVGAIRVDGSGHNRGMVRAFSGIDGTVLYEIYGDNDSDEFGDSITALSDVNDDSVPDFVVGAKYNDDGGVSAGKVKVISGVDGTILYELIGSSDYDYLGMSIGELQDINGDSVADIVVGASGDDTVASSAGLAHIASGKDGAPLFFLYGENESDFFGTSVDGIQDLNGDGLGDVMVSATGYDGNGNNIGTVKIYVTDSDGDGDGVGSLHDAYPEDPNLW